MRRDSGRISHRGWMLHSGNVPGGSVSVSNCELTPSMYRVTQEIEFCYGHRLLNYEGKCRFLHGHNGRAVIVLEGEHLDKRGMLLDFNDIKREVRSWIDNNLDHRMILCEGDPALPLLQTLGEPLLVIDSNPTAENIARLIYEHAAEKRLPILEVSLWETPHAYATYRA